MTRRNKLAFSIILAALAVAAWFAYSRSRSVTSPAGVELGALPSGSPRDLNVLLITLDTTRWDRMGAYGDKSAETPHFDRLASEGVLFEQAISSAPLTLPSHSTMFTGMLPPGHGVRDNGGFVLDPARRTLATILKDAGWSTGGFVGAFVLDGKFGLNQGFETYHDKFDVTKYKSISLGSVARTAGEVVDHALPWLQSKASQRFFAWLHLYDAHSPYDPPEPYRSRFRDRPYAGEIAYVDSQVGRVLTWLETAGLSERTVVIALGDHGESLHEHGESTHGLFIYDSTIRIPFVVRTPYASTRGRRVTSTVRTEDLMPTVLDLVGQAAPHGVQGRSLVPLMTGASADLSLDAYSESLYARNHYGWSELRSLRSGRYKYIATTRPELYDLERDPAEQKNLYDERRPLADRMATELERLAADKRHVDAGPVTVDPETRERLAALGYIGSFTRTAAAPGEKLPDPKDKIHIFNAMMSAHEARPNDGGEDAIARLTRVVKEDPDILDAWVMLGNEYFRKRDFRAALAQYQRALQINPDYDLATINLANAYRALGEYEAAIVGYERYLQKDPKNALVRYQLGELYVDLNRLDEAESEFRQALSDDTRVASARNALGVIAFKRGDLAKAEQEIRAALAQKSDVRLAHYNLALIAEQRRDYAAAIQEYEKEIELHATAYKAAFNLAKLHEQTGNVPAQETAYRKSVELNPRFAEGYFYLAKLYLDQQRLDDAMTYARRGLEVGAESEYAALGHYVLADVYSRRRMLADSQREAALGRQKEARMRARERGGAPRSSEAGRRESTGK
jgi:arylsulfatase A-like enzyme/Tfp pilus assembly protein PilF